MKVLKKILLVLFVLLVLMGIISLLGNYMYIKG